MAERPILYSFRRCPYAMRARMALWIAGIAVELREVKLANKPPQLIEASAKATVPVLILPDGAVVDESLEIMRWALARNDPEGWLTRDDAALIARNDGAFKHHLDRYKYPNRYEHEDEGNAEYHRQQGYNVLADLNTRLSENAQLCGTERGIADVALFPFIRQFANHDRAWFDAQPLPQLQAWLAGHLASDLFAGVMAKFVPWAAEDAPIYFGQNH